MDGNYNSTGKEINLQINAKDLNGEKRDLVVLGFTHTTQQAQAVPAATNRN